MAAAMLTITKKLITMRCSKKLVHRLKHNHLLADTKVRDKHSGNMLVQVVQVQILGAP